MYTYSFQLFCSLDLNKRKRLDTYVRDHLESLKGQLCISIAEAKKSKEHGQVEENAVAPIEIGQPLDRNQYELRKSQRMRGRKNRSKSSILNPLDQMNAVVPIFPNGCDNLTEGKKLIELIHTCGLDSILSVLSCLYFDYEAFRDFVDQHTWSDLSRLLQLMYQQRRIEHGHEQIRYDILKKMLTNTSFVKETDGLVHMNAGTTLNFMYTRLFSNSNDFIGSKTETANCSMCGFQSEVTCSHININLNDFDFQNVESSLEANSNRQCRNCTNNIPTINIAYKSVVTIDTEQIHFGGADIFSCKIDDITKTMVLNETEYDLYGVIQHESDPEHFIAHVKRKSNDWVTYDDLVGREHECDKKKEISIHMLFYKKKHFGKYIRLMKILFFPSY